MKNLVLAALLTAAASAASAGPYAGVEYRTDSTATNELLGDDIQLTMTGFETYVGYDEKIAENTTIDLRLGYIVGDIELATDIRTDSVDSTGYEISVGLENKFDDITIYSRYNYTVMSSEGYEVPSYGIKFGVRYDF